MTKHRSVNRTWKRQKVDIPFQLLWIGKIEGFCNTLSSLYYRDFTVRPHKKGNDTDINYDIPIKDIREMKTI